MTAIKRAAPFLFLQFIPLLIFPPALLAGALVFVAIVVAVALGLAIMVWRGRTWALTMSIFLQGLNVIVRVMMLLPRAMSQTETVDVAFIITSVLAIAASWVFLYRFDRPELRAAMVA